MSYITTPTYGAKNPVTGITGRATTTSTKILVASLSSAAVTVTVNGSSYVSGVNFTMTARGTNICWTGVLEITSGLSASTRYPWSATNGTDSDSGSFFVEPTNTTDTFQFHFAGCDNNTTSANPNNDNPWTVPGYWQHIKTQAQAANPPVAGILYVDDLGYVDNILIVDDGSSYASATFPGQSGKIMTTTPAEGGVLDDYLIGWCALLGMLGPTQTSYTEAQLAVNDSLLEVLWAREENRAWCRKNVNMWTQWGDHDIKSDIAWDTQPTGAVGTAWGSGKSAWESFYGLIQPPLISNTLPASFNGSTGVRRDTAAKHWAFQIGNTVIATLDGMTNVSRASWVAVASPNNATTVDSTGLTLFTTVYGTAQIDDLLEALDYMAGSYTVLALAHSVRYLVARTNSTPPETFSVSTHEWQNGAQHPVYDHCLADYQRLFTSTTGTAGGSPGSSLMKNNKTNGIQGNLICVHGDYHHGQVLKLQRAAYTGNALENWYAINNGTTNSSAYFPAAAATVLDTVGNAPTGATVADCYMEYNSTNGPTNFPTGPMFHGTQFKNYDSGRWLSVRFADRDDSALWERKFMRSGGNYAFPLTWEFVKVGGSLKI